MSRPRSTGSNAPVVGRGMQILGWVLVGVIALVVAMAGITTLILVKGGSGGVPVVSDIQATLDGNNIAFTWADPGIGSNDSYEVTVNDGLPSVQTDPTFLYAAQPGDHICIVVRVNQAGDTGAASSRKCVDVTG